MSLFGRVLSRAGLAGPTNLPPARPKGLAAPLARAAEAEMPEEEQPGPAVARTAASPEQTDEPEKMAPLARSLALRRAADEAPKDEPEQAAPLHRQKGEPGQEPEVRPLRRAAVAEEPEEAPVARSLARAAAEPAPEPEEKAQPLHRAPQVSAWRYPVLPALVSRDAPDAAALDAETSPKPAANSAEPENPPAMALRRAATPAPAPGPAMGDGPAFDPPAPALSAPQPPADAPQSSLWQAFEPERPSAAEPANWEAFQPAQSQFSAPQAERPRVVIEQIDVAITEPASPGRGQADFVASLNRALRSRYLGG